MVNHRFLVVRLRRQHYERIKNDAEAKGFENVSEYIRSITLNDEIGLHQKITEIHNTLVNRDSMHKTRHKEKTLMAFMR